MDVLAFRCDANGIVEEVFADRLGLSRALAAGESMLTIIDPHSHEKAMQFLAAVTSRQAASGWELTVGADGVIFPAVFTGAAQQDRLFIVVGRSARDITNVVESLELINNEQLNSFRMAFRDQADRFDKRSRSRESTYDELTKLNNELANAQREIVQKSSELARLNEEKNRFMGMAAHDLRNPLTVILAYSDFLLTDSTTDELEKKKIYEEMAIACRFMLGLINDLLDVSRIEAGARELYLSTFDASALIGQVVKSYVARAGEKEISIEVEMRREPIQMTSDSGKLNQIVANLLSNAIKYSPRATRVVVRASSSAEELAVEVADQGIGIPTEQQEAIFKPFVHLDATGTAGERSTGLGLSIVTQLVALLGGRIALDSEVGRGSTFRVTLPLFVSASSR